MLEFTLTEPTTAAARERLYVNGILQNTAAPPMGH